MKKLILLALACFPSALMASSLPREPYGYRVAVTSVYDGDTFDFDGSAWSPFPNLRWSIRIRGIDTPEKRSKCEMEKILALKARDVSVALIREARGQIFLSAIQHDKYGGRFDAVVTLPDGRVLGDILISKGLARPYFGGKKEPWCKGAGR